MSPWSRRRTGTWVSQPGPTYWEASDPAPGGGSVQCPAQRNEKYSEGFFSPCCLRCCQPWCCNFLSAVWSPSLQRWRPGRWARHRYLMERPHFSYQIPQISNPQPSLPPRTFRSIYENFHLFEDSQTEQPLPSNMSFLHYLCKHQRGTILPLGTRTVLCWRLDLLQPNHSRGYIRQWGSGHGTHQRSHSQADPL